MRKARKLLILGVWVAVLPYLGFPGSWKNILFLFSGLGIMYFSYVLYKDAKIIESRENVFDNFSENNGFGKNEIEVLIEEGPEQTEDEI